jgi:hypothetical protein
MKEDLQQYITNLLYYAYTFDKTNKLVDNKEFDDWVDEMIEGINEYFIENSK